MPRRIFWVVVGVPLGLIVIGAGASPKLFGRNTNASAQS
jgi:hypothetical protein